MKIYQIPKEHIIKLDQWKSIEKDFYSSFKLIENLTGIEPLEIREDGKFGFRPKNLISKKDMPNYLRKDSCDYLVPRKSNKKGKEISKRWEEAQIPDISKSGFIEYMFGIKTYNAEIKYDTINGKLHVVQCEGIDLLKYGYIEIDI